MSLLNSLGALEVDGIIRVAQIEPDLEYLFHHAMLQDAAYSTLLESDRKKLHLMVGEAVEYLYPNRQEELAGTLALHFQKAGEDGRALRYFIQLETQPWRLLLIQSRRFNIVRRWN